jgi:PDZ domain
MRQLCIPGTRLRLIRARHWRFLASLCTALFAASVAPASVAGAQGPVLHVVFVVDLDAGDIKKHLELDLGALKSPFTTQVRADHLHLVERTNGLTRQGVLGLFTQGKVDQRAVDPNDAIVFIFDGHGSFDPDRKDLSFSLRSSGQQLFRDEVVKAVEGCKPRLTVVVNGSCTNIVRKSSQIIAVAQSAPSPQLSDPFTAAVRRLFVDPRGTVLLSAASPGQFAAAFPGVATPNNNALIFRGTLFVQALASELVQGAATAAPPDWPELVTRLQKAVANDYTNFIVPIDAFPGQTTQTVAAVLDLDLDQSASIARWGVTVKPVINGLKIVAVVPGSWAAAANLSVGDVVVGLNDTELDAPADLRTALAGLSDDDLFRVVGFRADGQPISFFRRLRDGVGSLALARRLGAAVVAVPQGLRLQSVEAGSLAEQLKFKPGEILVSLNGKKMQKLEDVAPALAAIGSEALVAVEVIVNTGQLVQETRTAGN